MHGEAKYSLSGAFRALYVAEFLVHNTHRSETSDCIRICPQNFFGAQDIQLSVSRLIYRIWTKLGIGLGPGPMNIHNSACLGVFGGEDDEYRHPGSRRLLAVRQWNTFRFPVIGSIWQFQKTSLVLHQISSNSHRALCHGIARISFGQYIQKFPMVLHTIVS